MKTFKERVGERSTQRLVHLESKGRERVILPVVVERTPVRERSTLAQSEATGSEHKADDSGPQMRSPRMCVSFPFKWLATTVIWTRKALMGSLSTGRATKERQHT